MKPALLLRTDKGQNRKKIDQVVFKSAHTDRWDDSDSTNEGTAEMVKDSEQTYTQNKILHYYTTSVKKRYIFLC